MSHIFPYVPYISLWFHPNLSRKGLYHLWCSLTRSPRLRTMTMSCLADLYQGRSVVHVPRICPPPVIQHLNGMNGGKRLYNMSVSAEITDSCPTTTHNSTHGRSCFSNTQERKRTDLYCPLVPSVSLWGLDPKIIQNPMVYHHVPIFSHVLSCLITRT